MARRKCYSSVTMMLMQNYLEDLGGEKVRCLNSWDVLWEARFFLCCKHHFIASCIWPVLPVFHEWSVSTVSLDALFVCLFVLGGGGRRGREKTSSVSPIRSLLKSLGRLFITSLCFPPLPAKSHPFIPAGVHLCVWGAAFFISWPVRCVSIVLHWRLLL